MSQHYKALTRKYRPATFDDIVSQKHVSDTLLNAIEQNRLSHAYLFCGPRGVGKTTMARVLARTINDVDATVDGEALNQTLNIIEVDAASNNKVEDANRIREAVRVPPQTGSYKIFIIDEVHMLSKSAFNALLKTLEEPPAHAIFIFATTEPHKVLPTILSRVQRFDFKPIQVQEIVDHLKIICEKEDITIDDESLHIVARKADGALRDALGLLDQVIAFCGTTISYSELQKALNVVGIDRLFELTDHITQKDTVAGIQLVHDLLMEGHDINEFLVSLTEHFRNMLLATDPKNLYAIDSSKEMKQKLIESASAFTEDDLLRMLHIIHETQFKIRDAHQPRILLEMTVLKLIKMERTDSLKQLLKELAELKKSLESGGSSTNTPIAKDEPDSYKASSKSADPAPRIETSKQAQPARPASAVSSRVMGKPALDRNRPQNNLRSLSAQEPEQQQGSVTVDGNLALASQPAEETKNESAENEKIYLHDIRENWNDYVDSLHDSVPSFVRLTMQNTRPIDVRNRQIVIECNDSFASKLIEEHHTSLVNSLKRITGKKLSLHCKVKAIQQDNELNDPFKRFKILQQEDPKIRTIVDVFGAEIDL